MIFAISGFKRSGKDSIADHLVKTHGFERVSFADPLKDMVASCFDIPRTYLDNPEYKEKALEQYPVPAADKFTEMVSKFMAKEFRTIDGFGANESNLKVENGVLKTFVSFLDQWETLHHTPRSLAILMGSSMRAGDTSYWAKQAVSKIKKSAKHVVISDLRYRSEVAQLREAFGDEIVTLRVNRFDTSPSSDPSELDLVGFVHDYSIDNETTLTNLFLKIDMFVYKIKIEKGI